MTQIFLVHPVVVWSSFQALYYIHVLKDKKSNMTLSSKLVHVILDAKKK